MGNKANQRGYRDSYHEKQDYSATMPYRRMWECILNFDTV